MCDSRAVTKWSNQLPSGTAPRGSASGRPSDGRSSMKARIIGAAVLAAALARRRDDCDRRQQARDGATSRSGSRSTRSAAGRTSSRPRTPHSRSSTPASTSTSSTRRGARTCGKFDATLAGGNAPDVIEMGNTEMTKYMAAGAFQDSREQVVVRRTRAPGSRPRGLRPVQREDLRRPVLRRLAGRHVPQGPVPAGGDQEPPTSLARSPPPRRS